MSKKASLTFLIALFLYSFYCAFQLGENWDSTAYYELGKERLNYFFSLGEDKSYKSFFSGKFVPGFYNTISAFFTNFFPRKYIIESIYIINLVFSISAVFGISKISKELFNKQIGKITFVFCFFNPIFFGHMAMNGIDTIITFANIWLFYKILRYLKHQHNKEKRNSYVIYSGVLLGLGLGVRYSFLITLIPVLFFLILEITYFKSFIGRKFSKKIFVQDSIKVLVIGYLLMVLFWPHTYDNIFLLPIKLAIESFSFGFGVPFAFLNGEIFFTNDLPKNYILINLFYKMPEFIIFSFIIFIFLFLKLGPYFKKRFKGFNFKIFLIFTIILFPNIFFWISPYAIYDGIRLFLYLIPFICIIPALVVFFLFKMIKNNLYKSIFLFLILSKIFFLINFFYLTPYHYAYLNLFAGKYSEHSNKFENDYWAVSTKELISHINNQKEFFEGHRVRIATCGVPTDTQYRYLMKIKNLKFKMVSNEEDFDFIIMNNRIISEQKSNFDDLKKAQTCFQKFVGEDLIKVQRRGLVLSKITKI